MQVLIEIFTGNHRNQGLAFNGQVVSLVNSILKEDPKDDLFFETTCQCFVTVIRVGPMPL